MRRKTVITDRDSGLFRLLVRARWLSTSQIQSRFFPGKAANAVNKRMRKLVSSGILACVRPGMTEQQYYRLVSPAKRYLETQGLDPETIIIPRKLPANLTHFERINDVRLWFESQHDERQMSLIAFYAEWEINDMSRSAEVVPDGLAVINLDGRRSILAVEIDLGTENAKYFRKKIKQYQKFTLGPGQGIDAVLVFALGRNRIRALIKVLYDEESPRCIMADLERLPELSVRSHAYLDLSALANASGPLLRSLTDLLGCPVEVSCREERV